MAKDWKKTLKWLIPLAIGLALYQAYSHYIIGSEIRKVELSTNSFLEIYHEENSSKRVERTFDIEGSNDVLVFLHIQKTSGTTFATMLVRNIQLSEPCSFRKHARRSLNNCWNKRKHVWLYSHYSTGWGCGVHADWTSLHECVGPYFDELEQPNPKRRYL